MCGVPSFSQSVSPLVRMILPRIRNASRKALHTMDEEHVFQMVRAICQILSLPALGTGINKDVGVRVIGTLMLKGKGTGTAPRYCCTTV